MLTNDELVSYCEAQNWRCCFCGKPFLDHSTSIEFENIMVFSCTTCYERYIQTSISAQEFYERKLYIKRCWKTYRYIRRMKEFERNISGLKIQLCEAQNWRCCYCGTHVDFDRERGDGNSKSNNATLEHVETRSNNGSDTWDNLVIACRRCNNLRSNYVSAYQFYEDRLFEGNKMRRYLINAGLVGKLTSEEKRQHKQDRKEFVTLMNFMFAILMFPDEMNLVYIEWLHGVESKKGAS